MHVEDASGGRDIAIVLIKHSLDVLPLKAANRKRVCADRYFGIAGGALKC
jgi:hypothetical protein